jgi:hypothetical protein
VIRKTFCYQLTEIEILSELYIQEAAYCDCLTSLGFVIFNAEIAAAKQETLNSKMLRENPFKANFLTVVQNKALLFFMWLA